MRVYVAGHRGMVGGAISRKLIERGAEVVTRTHAELDLTDQRAVRDFLLQRRSILSFLRQRRWAASMPTTLTLPSLFMKT